MNKHIKHLLVNCGIYTKLFNTYYTYKFREARLLKENEEFKAKYYIQTSDAVPFTHEKIVIAMFDGKKLHGGLADRLRGIISLYLLCKKYHIRFKIYFIYPFNLLDFFQPNSYDWRIQEKDIIYDAKYSEPIILDTMEQYGNEKKFQMNYLTDKILNSPKRQFHVYTNAAFSMSRKIYPKLFSELFVPSYYLKKELNTINKQIKCEYINAAFRFLNLLGDFNEMGVDPLPDEEKRLLITACVNQLYKLHKKNKKNILVTSDSITFLEEVSKCEFVITNKGKILHVDFSEDNRKEMHLKTFIDFLLIANAQEVYLFRTGKMYKSGFAKSASLIYGRPYYEIVF